MTNWHVEQLHMEPLIPPYFLLLSGPDKGSPALANVFTKCLHSPFTGHAKMHVTSNACRLRESANNLRVHLPVLGLPYQGQTQKIWWDQWFHMKLFKMLTWSSIQIHLAEHYSVLDSVLEHLGPLTVHPGSINTNLHRYIEKHKHKTWESDTIELDNCQCIQPTYKFLVSIPFHLCYKWIETSYYTARICI